MVGTNQLGKEPAGVHLRGAPPKFQLDWENCHRFWEFWGIAIFGPTIPTKKAWGIILLDQLYPILRLSDNACEIAIIMVVGCAESFCRFEHVGIYPTYPVKPLCFDFSPKSDIF